MTTAIILAGGLGTRLRSAVPDVPKPMAEIRGRPFLEHQMDYWIGQGVNRFVLSVGYQSKVIMDHFGAGYRGVPVEYAVEEEPLGTGGGFLMAVKGQKGTVLVLNGDTFFAVDLGQLMRFHAEKRSEWTFSLFRANEAGRYMGMDVATDGRILALKSGTDQLGRLANGGVYLVNPSVLSKAHFVAGDKLSLEDDILPNIVADRRVLYGLECTGKFIDIGVPEDYFRAADVLPH